MADVLGNEVSQPTRIAVERTKRISRIRSVARTISSRRRIGGRAMVLVNDHESFLALSSRGALSILEARFTFARAFYLISGEPMVNCALRTKSIWRNTMSSSQ